MPFRWLGQRNAASAEGVPQCHVSRSVMELTPCMHTDFPLSLLLLISWGRILTALWVWGDGDSIGVTQG
jgi:hypothetical protein